MGWLLRSDDSAPAALYSSPLVGPFEVTVTTTGELKAKNSVKIYGPRSARQIQIWQMSVLRLVPEGTVVKAGDFVAELDRSELASRTQEANFELQKAQSQYEQAQLDSTLTLTRLRDEQVNLRYSMEEARLRMEQAAYEAPSVKRQAEIDFEKSSRALDQAIENYRTQVLQAEAKMREVEAELFKARNRYQILEDAAGDFIITAPENGMVVYRRQRRGQKLTVGGTLNAWDPVVAELPDLSEMESITYVNEVDIQKVSVGQSVRIGLDADPDKRLTGTVTQVANIGEQRPNSDAKVFEVSITVAGSDTTLRPAMTTSNTIVVAKIDSALYVPLETIHTADSLTFVFTERGGNLGRQQVTLGLMNENQAIVENGVTPNDRLYLSMPADTTGLPFWPIEEPRELARNYDS
jgi:multidrug efflux pump subunit AcrA (membrane-fusion protein)